MHQLDDSKEKCDIYSSRIESLRTCKLKHNWYQLKHNLCSYAHEARAIFLLLLVRLLMVVSYTQDADGGLRNPPIAKEWSL
jgi:hypothetical protein